MPLLSENGAVGETPWPPAPAVSRGWPAWLLSLALHASLLLALGLLLQVSYRGAAIEADRGGGIVLARNEEGTAQYFGRDDQAPQDQQQAAFASSRAKSALPTMEQLPLDLAGALPEQGADLAVPDSGQNLPSVMGFTADTRPSGGRVGGNQVRTSVFGVEGTGTKFVYVFDRSASMAGYGGRPLAAAKAELIASLNDLEQIHQFQIIFYNDRPTVFNPFQPRAPRMLYGDEPNRRLAKNFVRAIIAASGTRHMEALKLAISMHPDVIFFLTDAAEPQLSPSQLNEIRRRNVRVGATINAIEFGAGPYRGGVNFLVQLARENGGQHAYVDVTRLPRVP